MAALYAVGDVYMGGLGTVTYAHDNVVLAFGHPLDWSGESSIYMTNALGGRRVVEHLRTVARSWIRARCAARSTQDRNSGIAGTLAEVPVGVPVTSQATLMPRTARP